MAATNLIRTGSGSFQFESTPVEDHDLPAPSRTLSAGAGGFSARSTTTVHLQVRDKQQNHRQDMRGVPLPSTLHSTASCDSLFLSDNGSSAILNLGISGVGSSRSASSSTTKSALLDDEVALGFSSGGAGGGNTVGGRPGGGSGDQHRGMGTYYREMLEADPKNPLLLMNYGKYLHEVEGDFQGAEDCFGRAVLASPGDGEVLSLYGNLVWEAHRDEQRAEDYFQRAVQAAPDDCYVLGSYAHFLWDADEEDDADSNSAGSAPPSSSVATRECRHG